jgi:hypothetical protein
MQCLGRRVRDKKKDEGTGVFWFIRPRHRFFVPFRCSNEASGLCADCIERQRKTGPYVAKMSAKGTHIPNQGTLFHGLLTEAPPAWSHVYKSSWYDSEIAAGAELSVQDKETLEEIWESVYKDIEPPTSMEKKPRGKKAAAVAPLAPPVPAPVAEAEAPVAEAPVKKFRAKKTVASASIAPPVLAPLAALAALAAPIPVPVPAPAAIPAPVPTKKRGPPKKAAASVAPIGIVTSELKEDIRIIDINVKKATINDRSVYLGPKDKVYDLKFKYIGRYSRATDAIVSHPDSDAD